MVQELMQLSAEAMFSGQCFGIGLSQMTSAQLLSGFQILFAKFLSFESGTQIRDLEPGQIVHPSKPAFLRDQGSSQGILATKYPKAGLSHRGRSYTAAGQVEQQVLQVGSDLAGTKSCPDTFHSAKRIDQHPRNGQPNVSNLAI